MAKKKMKPQHTSMKLKKKKFTYQPKKNKKKRFLWMWKVITYHIHAMILYYQYRLVIFNKMDLDYCTFKYYYHHPRNVWTKGHLVDSQFIIPMWTMWWWHTFGDTLILELHHKSSFIPQAHEIKEVNMTKNTCYFSKLTTFFW